jgi:hypothetical protein
MDCRDPAPAGNVAPKQGTVLAAHDPLVAIAPGCLHDHPSTHANMLEFVVRRIQSCQGIASQFIGVVAEHLAKDLVAVLYDSLPRNAEADSGSAKGQVDVVRINLPE